MRVIAKKALRDFYTQPAYRDAEGPLLAWFREAEAADWRTPADVRAKYGSASFVGDRVVFNIKGNDYRLVVQIKYEFHVVYIRYVGTHKQYDGIDVETL